MKLTDAAGMVVECFTYGTYGELLSGDASLTHYLYNGCCGVSTDANGLYYMRQRYYNPEIKRFINQDILTGSLSNSQSLNQYCYVQGNPVSYTDPFGLAPTNGLYTDPTTNTSQAHVFFSMLGMIPGVVGVTASIADGLVYGLVDGDYGMMTLCMLDALSLGLLKKATTLLNAGKNTKTARTLLFAGRFGANAASFGMCAGAAMAVGFGAYDRYLTQGAENFSVTEAEVASVAACVLGCIISGGGMVKSVQSSVKVMRQQGMANVAKSERNVLINSSNTNWSFGHLSSEASLNKRQRELLRTLNTSGSTVVVHKKSVSMNDLRQLTNVTGDEFNMFTNGSRRLIIRGCGNEIRVSQEMYNDILNGVYGKFSGHTHPGFSLNPGPADEPFLKKLGQNRSSIWGNTGEGWLPFGQDRWSTQDIQIQIRHEKMAKIYGGFE